MIGWRPDFASEAHSQLTLDDLAPDCGDKPPADPEPDDELTWDEWFRSLPRTP